jgi:hypothetical protein
MSCASSGNEPRPISPKYGNYDFPGIKQALFNAGGINLIAYQRPKNSDFDAYVETLKSWVNRLLVPVTRRASGRHAGSGVGPFSPRNPQCTAPP